MPESREEARANLKADFDKDTVVDLLCARVDELEEQRAQLLEACHRMLSTRERDDYIESVMHMARVVARAEGRDA